MVALKVFPTHVKSPLKLWLHFIRIIYVLFQAAVAPIEVVLNAGVHHVEEAAAGLKFGVIKICTKSAQA